MKQLPEKLVALWNETLEEPVDPFLAILDKLPLSTKGRGDGPEPTRGS